MDEKTWHVHVVRNGEANSDEVVNEQCQACQWSLGLR